ncbi:hypothetical protein PInf_011122 [Phytophthora infestans]|nr:hypothetical protein PInf_011122 [Phytophthora infestans]
MSAATPKTRKREEEKEEEKEEATEPMQEFRQFQGQETHQLYKIRSTVSVKDRNKARTKQAARRESTAELWDESLGNYAVYFICTHGWQFKPRDQGKRTNHIIRAIQCQAKLSANLVKGKDGLFQVRVSKHYASHNHDVGPAVYYSYSEARQVNSPATKGVVKTLVQGGSKKKKILRYLKEVSGKPILPKDVENLIAKMRRETYTSQDDNVRVSQLLKDFS